MGKDGTPRADSRWTDFYEHAADEGPLQTVSNGRRGLSMFAAGERGESGAWVEGLCRFMKVYADL